MGYYIAPPNSVTFYPLKTFLNEALLKRGCLWYLIQVSALLELLFLAFIAVHMVLKLTWYGAWKFITSKRAMLIVSHAN